MVDFRRHLVLASLPVNFARRLHQIFAAVARAGLDAVIPPTCLSCDSIVAPPGGLCAGCWGSFAWIERPYCARCGTPFDAELSLPSAELLCAACLAGRSPLSRVRSVLRYDAASRALLLGFKHADRTHAAPFYGRWLARAGADALAGADMLVPVPLHWTRLVWRRFNQSALLANSLAHACGVPCIPDLLIRQRRTPIQGSLGRSQRRRNVRRAFLVRPRFAKRVRGARIVLVDDVLTTGATLEECARALRRAGAAEVRGLTLARVVLPGEAG
ncbi:MAG: ComF family protein [Alphaproteobacteria bacterium]|nr:ComF family protein [Alphaproteobacteria bacterium]